MHAEAMLKGKKPVTPSFISLLEMPLGVSPRAHMYISSVSILYWRCDRVGNPWAEDIARTLFQFSIGDAVHSNSCISATYLFLFQFSIGDALLYLGGAPLRPERFQFSIGDALAHSF